MAQRKLRKVEDEKVKFIDKIKEIPIVDHAERMGFTVTRKGNGKYYSLREHDSVMIDIEKNCFWRNSTFSSGFKGGAGSIIDFVMEFGECNDAKSAIESIASEYGIERDNYKKVVIPKKERVVVASGPKREPGDLALPERDTNTRAVYNYLLNTRKLNKDVVDYFVENDMLYQDKRRNAVFKTDRFACLRSTGQKKFVMDIDGCDYNQCFFFKSNENADTLIVGESVIDVMSIMSVYANHGTDFRNFAYLALSGTNKLGSVFYNLENEPGIKNVIIGCDNDQAGRDATAKIIQGLQERNFEGTWREAIAPSGKDWNEYLVMRANDASITQQNEKTPDVSPEKPRAEYFGKIIQDIYQTAISSEEHTWFLEKDRFEDGEFSQEDLDVLNRDIETLKTDFGIGEDINSIIESYDHWEDANDVVATFYGDFINIFEDREKEMEKTDEDKVTVAIESTDDYADSSFHKELIDSDIQNEDGSYGKMADSYRLVTIGDNGRLKAYDNEIFESAEAALSHAQKLEGIEIISYDDIVHRTGINIMQNESASLSQENIVENNKDVRGYKYYSILRPIGPGTYPKEGMREFQNFDARQYVNEIGKEAWGVLTYDRKLTESETSEYDLESIPLKNMDLEQRLQGQQLEAAKNMIDSLRETGNVDDEEKGIVNLYYSTDQKTADTIIKTEKMKSEDFGDGKGVLLSTEPEPLKDGDVVIRLSVPVESLKLDNYDIESEKATFYFQSEERIFSVRDYAIQIEEIPHGEEQINNGLNTVKEEYVDRGFERFLESLEYTDVKDQILMFDFAKRQDESLFPIEFSNENGYIFETGEKYERIIDFVYEKSNQRILFEWLEKQGADFDDLVDIIHGEIPSFEKPDSYKYYICQEEWSDANLPEGVVGVEHLNEKQPIENSIEDAFAIASFNRKLTPEEQWSNHLIRAYKLEKRKMVEELSIEGKERVAGYFYEHNDGDQIWQDTTDFYVDEEGNYLEIKFDGYFGKETIKSVTYDEIIKDMERVQKEVENQTKPRWHSGYEITFNELNKVRENMAKERSQHKSETTQENKPRETISFAGTSKDEMKEHLVTGIQNIMNSDDYKNWLNTGSKLFYNNYSFNNAMLIWMQKENATHVMGYEAWKEFGRAVQKGAKGAKILMPVMAYEKTQGGLYKMIMSGLNEQLKKDPDLSTAIYRLYSSKIEFTMNKSNMIGLRVDGKEKGIFENHEQLKKFISKNILGKIPMYFTVGTVFDAKDTYAPEFLWVSKGYTKDELVLDDKGNPIKSKKGEYKIYNTPERQARFKPAMDTSIVAKDPEKMKILMDVLVSVSEKNGVPVYMRNKNEDDTLKGGAAGYFSRKFNDEHPKGYIAIDKELEITEMCSVMIHEMGHSDMHGNLDKIQELSAEMGEEATRNIRELQAESVAYMTASTFGIDTETHSFNYLAAYAQGFDIQGLQKSMDAIYRECKKLTSDIATELDARGLNLDLSKKDPEQMISPKEVDKIAQEYMEFAMDREEVLNEVQKEMPSLVMENRNDDNIMSILKEQKENVLSQMDDISIIKEHTESLEKASNRDEQDRSIENLEKAKERIEIKVEQFERLSEDFISYRNDRKGTLREEFQKSPTKVLNELSKSYPKLKDLSDSQLHYVATSRFIQKNYRALLDTSPEAFVNVVMKRAEAIPGIASKNGVFVEVNFCEKWTEQPIFENGSLCHPKVANMVIKNAEEQIQGLRKAAKEQGEYFPYSKCDLTIYYSHEKGNRMAFNTRVDIGDGSQRDLVSHLESIVISKRKELIDNFSSGIKELKAKDKIAHVEIKKEDMGQCVQESKEDSKVCPMKEWKEQVNDRKMNPVEKNPDEHQKKDLKGKNLQERG